MEPSLNCCLMFFHLRCFLSIVIKQLNDERIAEPITSLLVGNGIVFIIQGKECFQSFSTTADGELLNVFVVVVIHGDLTT